jgi:hypothetical protein
VSDEIFDDATATDQNLVGSLLLLHKNQMIPSENKQKHGIWGRENISQEGCLPK